MTEVFTGMRVVNEKPPVWENILAAFKINVDSTLFTYGDILYNPAGVHIPDDYLYHESIHAAQQGHTAEGAGKWWARYFQDQYFRIDQEARAYGAQYEFFCKSFKDRNVRSRKLYQLASSLSGPMYGNIINHSAAMKIIKSHSKI